MSVARVILTWRLGLLQRHFGWVVDIGLDATVDLGRRRLLETGQIMVAIASGSDQGYLTDWLRLVLNHRTVCLTLLSVVHPNR